MGFDAYGDSSSKTFKDYINKSDDIFKMVQTFIANITHKKETREEEGQRVKVYDIFTLHDAVGRLVPVRKDNPSNKLEPSDYCKARDVFIKILQFIKDNFEEFTPNSVLFRYASRISGLSASSRTCTTLAEKYNLDPLFSLERNQKSSLLKAVTGGAKSRRIRRRKHSRKSHRKRARKTHHKRGGRRTHSYAKRKRASKSHKRRK